MAGRELLIAGAPLLRIACGFKRLSFSTT
jgi:hypothetical protein